MKIKEWIMLAVILISFLFVAAPMACMDNTNCILSPILDNPLFNILSGILGGYKVFIVIVILIGIVGYLNWRKK